MNDKAAWGGPAEMSAWEALLWRSEADPRTSSTGILMEILDREPDWDRFVAAHDRISREIPRLRERVVVPAVQLVQPVWSPDPDFDLTYHVQSVRLPSPGTHRQLLDLCESALARPQDPNRPPWQSFLVTGLSDDRAALLFKFHHSLTDGMGLIQLLALAHSTSREPSASADSSTLVPTPPRTPTTSAELLTGKLRARALGTPAELARRTIGVGSLIGRTVRKPSEVLGTGLGYAQSLKRVLTPPPAGRSPLLKGTGTANRFLTIEVSLPDLKVAGKAGGGSINDAFMAGFLGGMRRYHEHHGSSVDSLLIGMPISLRQEGEAGGNRFAGARFAAPMAETDPLVRMELIRNFVRSARDEAAISFLSQLSPILTKLPSSAIIEISAGLTASSDFQVSNIKGIDNEVFIAGAKVLGMYPLGPRPGVAGTLAMITYNGTCYLGLNVNPDVFTDLDVLERCLIEGFAEVIEVGRPTTSSSKARP